MNAELIKEINEKCPYNQGIFKEPYAVPVHIKEPVIYCRHETDGNSDESHWVDSTLEGIPKIRFKVLDLVLEVLFPEIKDFQYKRIEELIHNNEETGHEYYGNSKDWKCEYIILSELESLIDRWKI